MNLSRQQVADIVSKRPAGVAPEDVIHELVAQGHQLEGYAPAAAAAPVQGSSPPPNTAYGQMMPGAGLARLGQSIAGAVPGIGRAAVGALPAVGGIAGGLAGVPAGPPGMIAGAALGGVGGEAWRQNLSRLVLGAQVETPETAVPKMVGQGAEQGAAEAIGQGVGKLAGMAGKSMMTKALSPAKELVSNFRTVVTDAIKNRIPVGAMFGGKLGSEGATALRTAATDKVKQILSQSAENGTMFDREAIAQPLIESVESKLGRSVTPLERANLIRKVSLRSGQLLTDATAGIKRIAIQGDPIMANELRRLGRQGASAEMKARALGLPSSAIPDLDAHIEEGARRFLNENVGGYQPAQQAAAKAIGLERAVKSAELRPSPPMVGMGLGPLHLGIGVPPEIASRLALLASNPALAPLLSNLLRGGGYVAHQALEPAAPQSP